MPTCCSCHIDGYKEKFPPTNSYNSDDYRFSASNIHSHHITHPTYSTIVNHNSHADDDDDRDGDDSGSIAYQYSNGFKRSPSIKQSKFGDSSLSSSVTKLNRYEKTKLHKPSGGYSAHPLDSYLTPPTSSDYEAVGGFGGIGIRSGGGYGLSGSRKRRRPSSSVRTHVQDQNIAGSDFLPDITLIPHHDYNTERSSSSARRKSTTPLNDAAAAAAAGHHSSSNRISTAGAASSTTGGGQLPSISTASTSSIDLGKRVNYNYHPIIDFFGDSLKSEKEIEDRVGYSEPTRTWRPVARGGGGVGVNGNLRRRQR